MQMQIFQKKTIVKDERISKIFKKKKLDLNKAKFFNFI